PLLRVLASSAPATKGPQAPAPGCSQGQRCQAGVAGAHRRPRPPLRTLFPQARTPGPGLSVFRAPACLPEPRGQTARPQPSRV
ncbi:unnamed protein product, partial [Gadus morhua 'NCC']